MSCSKNHDWMGSRGVALPVTSSSTSTAGLEGLGDCRQLRKRLVLEYLPGREPPSGAAGACDDLQTEDRVSAELEEIIFAADAIETEHLTADCRQCCLDWDPREPRSPCEPLVPERVALDDRVFRWRSAVCDPA